MTDAPTPNDPPTPANPAPPAPPVEAQRPEWLPETQWDVEAKAIKPEFGQHYTEVSKFYETETAKQSALKARKPDDIKIEVKLPDTVKVPDGMEIKIDEKDPRIPILRDLALERGLDQDTVNAFVAMDARMKIEAHNAEVARIQAEDTKLGAEGPKRKEAVSAWAKGLLDSKAITKDEHDELRMTAATAAGVTLLEKIMAKANGNIPGAGDPPPPAKPAEVPIEKRWYGQGQ